MRALAVDLGTKRIGVALGESDVAIVTPRPALAASGRLADDARALAAFARREEAEIVVVGLPVEASGEEGRMARVCRKLADMIAAEGFKTAMQDETLSSVEADARMAGFEMTGAERRKKRDSEAACLILERWFRAADPAGGKA
ncbi:Holliday junction resolvase RuvX [bacterium]|nr:MAG: Holliday junction resolvase RuvX [bacterium]